MKSKLKRLLATLICAAIAAALALGLYSYPRRAVPSITALIPSAKMVTAVRVRGLGPLWRGCSRSAFAARVREGDIFPVREMMAADERFKEDWQDLDASFIPEAFGRDCVVALYRRASGQPLAPAAWSRVGARARILHALRRLRATLCFWRPADMARRRVGGLIVNEVLDRKRGVPRFSYVLMGDLGIATTGEGVEFWRSIDLLMKGNGDSAEGTIPALLPPVRLGVDGCIVMRIDELRSCGDAWAAARASEEADRWEPLRDAWAQARDAIPAWPRVEGRFSLGSESRADLTVVTGAPADARERDISADPLARRMDRGGILYAGSAINLRELLGRLRDRCGAASVEFVRDEGATVFPADHFSLSWMGDDCSVLLYQDERGMVNAAASVLLRDRRIAAARIKKFLALADGAEFLIRDARGRQLAGTREGLDIEAKGAGREAYYRIGLGFPFEQLYAPVVAVRGDRLLIATSGSALQQPAAGRPPSAAAWGGTAGAHLVLKGSDAERAAASLRQILLLAAPFVRGKSERERIVEACRLLGAFEWLAPLREGWATATRDGDAIRIRAGAQFADIKKD